MNAVSPIRQGENVQRFVPWGQGPVRLRSFWRMMLLYAPTILGLTNEIGRILAGLNTGNQDDLIGPDPEFENVAFFLGHQKELQALGLELSAMQCARICFELDKGDLTVSQFRDLLNDLYMRLLDECEDIHLLALTKQESAYYQPTKPLFGLEVQARFPGVIYDIEEAAKCLALHRSTASVFHSIRSLESIIRAVARCMNIPDPTKTSERSWFKALKAIKDVIDQKWSASTARSSGDGQFCDEVYASLAAIQNPYRNATMHLDQKYTTEEARHIFEMVGGLMKRVSFRMDEQGEPKA